MEVSIVLAKIIGLYLFLICFIMLLNPKHFHEFLSSFANNPALITFSGIIALLFGIVILSVHSIWVLQWPIVITILGWLSLIKGVIQLAFPQLVSKMVRYINKKPLSYFSIAIIGILIGAYLIYHGLF